MAIPYHNPMVEERKRLVEQLDAAAAEWSTARRKLLAAQSGLSRAEQKFDRASKALERFDNPDLFEQRRS